MGNEDFIPFCTEMNENLFSITDSHKYNMNFKLINSTSFTLYLKHR
ncbi:hypothetical protein BN890_38340 [Bacteroides xylanisolvens SD CC 1b]|uniref:Uncharacterized protein n=2 Tax=Bacteroides xylanisolvens TaxID=371601 RepID=D6D119_9BACE|nr:hypothetical protein HMPREF0102_03253 [Bacteroides sp. 2_1_22]CBK68121.1 hypothetical protein BXY_31110 [Bacteroides xylanisolvens XB1A]CDM01678.1 hypothetical protein BN891_46170 [Bacteroides xylanisolvens SD CC 2a]CDM06231.1 hypothetical protein BN890_38340 [Bacteroides xylanisolvens SD CC 1b]